jgi:hypothetical protein
MQKRRGNPNWCKPTPYGAAAATPATFDALTASLGLAPEDFEGSAVLKEWVSRNKNHKYVPQDLLEAWGLTVDVGL